MEDFKQNAKMSCEGNHYKAGGKVKRFEGGGEVEAAPSAWHVYDNQTRERVNKTEYKSLKTANRAVDRLDDAHGGYRYTAKAAPAQPATLGPVNMTGSMGNTGGEPETGNYRNTRSSSTGGGAGGGGGPSSIKGLTSNPNFNKKRGGTVKRNK